MTGDIRSCDKSKNKVKGNIEPNLPWQGKTNGAIDEQFQDYFCCTCDGTNNIEEVLSESCEYVQVTFDRLNFQLSLNTKPS